VPERHRRFVAEAVTLDLLPLQTSKDRKEES
jgi:hypothetical protein